MRSFCVCGACVCSCDLIGVCILYIMAGGEGMGGGGGEQWAYGRIINNDSIAKR